MIPAWMKMRAKPTREQLLGARVLRNIAVTGRAAAGDGLRLAAPLKPTGLRRILGVRQAEKSFDLDGLGAFVWNAVDNRRTVEAIIRHFAAEKRVNLREAEVSVLAFLKTLTARGLVALSAPAAVTTGGKKQRAERRRKKRRDA